ncbi:DNRLRE domain-containing protein [Streptomyces sp. ok210]|uniref:DNRLRE domain-containing protein n=1 Tax=Streptomyces sp. ok210 TaxID=1761905 RepID=UPI00210CFF3F|nr:DNRLRE domain-containing protein [Streptomyces sp. ok210]
MVSLVLLAETALLVESTGMAVAVGQPAAATESATAPTYGPAEAADEASAVLMARLQNRKIEVLSERVADSTTWALPSGSLQTEIFPGPIRVKRDGTWLPVDTALADAGAHLEPKAAAAEVALSDGGDTALASVGQGDATFGLGWAEKLPTPTIKGSTAAYDLGDGQTLKATALARGFSENITLAGAPADAVSYRIPLQLDGLRLSQATSGHLLLKDEDGKLVAEAPAPMMWDASKNPASGESDHHAKVETKIETETDGSQTLVLTPDADFLARTDLTYPVTVDPTSTLAATTDTWVQTPDYPDSQQGSTELKSGTYDTGTNKARSYLKFDVTKFAGKHITDTNLALYSYYSSTCATTGAGTEVRRITGNWDSAAITWGAQPATTATGAVVNKAALGYDSSCPGGTMNFDIDTIVAAWASGSANYGLRIAGADETDPYTWRRFRSANYISGDNSAEPHLTVTYNSYATNSAPAVSPSQLNAYNGHRYVTSLTPTFSAKVTDADGGNAQAQFEVTSDPAYTDPTPVSYTALGKSVASGATSTLAVPLASAFPAGSHLRYRVRGYDGTDYGTWSGYSTFVLNTALPVAPTVSCPDYPASTWSAKAPGAVTCTLDTTSTDGQGFKWGLDDPAMAKRIDDTVNGTDGDPLTISITPGNGWHTLYAKTIDSGGNLSTATTSYAFGVGADGAALLSPGDGDRPARRVALSATGKPTYTGVTYQYRRGETDTWENAPLADVTKNADGTAVTAWPLAAPNGAPPALAWNITTSLAEDGPVDVRAAFTDGTTTGYSPTSTITVDRNAGTAPSAEVGPGSVNELTGDFAQSATDAEAFGMSVSRTASSRQPTAGANAVGQVAIFGPQWTSGTTVELTGSDWAYIRQTSATSLALVDVDGVETGFTATVTGGWKAELGAEEVTLTGSLTGSFTLKDNQGTTTKFAKVDPAATTWSVASTTAPTADSTTTVVSEKVVSGPSVLVRPKFIIAPTSAVSAATCSTMPSTKGCRVIEFVYATTTTATSTSVGKYAGQLDEIKLWSTAPRATQATAKQLTYYRYDDQGRLRNVYKSSMSPPLVTSYTYDSAGRITTMTPPGELPWTFAYGKAGNAATAGDGMLLAASRPTLKPGTKTETDGGTATASVVYDVPLTGSKAPNAMSSTGVAAWGQTDVPTDATAIFPADAVPTAHDGASLTAGDYTRATISYADASAREVNTAAPGGHISTTEYDSFGNEFRQLTAANRELALTTSGSGLEELTLLGINAQSTSARAGQLSTVRTYSIDGLRELESFGPLHQITLTSPLEQGAGQPDVPAGSELPAREHRVTAYDEGRPTDGSATVSDQPTTVTTDVHIDGFPADADARVTKTVNDWVKGLPVSTTDDPGGLNVSTTTTYNDQGRAIKTTLPKSNGSDAGTMITTYYSATGSGPCGGRPEWADLICSTAPAADITGGGTNPTQLPSKTSEYDWWGHTAKVVETANGVTRTTTTTFDSAGRPTTVAVTGGVGTTVADTTTTYDPNSGSATSMTSNGKTVVHSTDLLGRTIAYDDGAGNTTTTEYDKLDRPVKVTDSAPSTTTYHYDTTLDPRGLETSRTDSVAGAITSSYDAEANVANRQFPGGYTLFSDHDPTGRETVRIYTRDSDGAVMSADTVGYSADGQIVNETNTSGQSYSRTYDYDSLGRLTQVDDVAPDESCTRRAYAFDANSNRTALGTTTSAPATACTSSGVTSTAYSYDTGDRLIASGTMYDAFGRTTTQATGTTIEYFTNDLVRRQTSENSRQTWNLDAAGRLASWTTETESSGSWTQSGSKANHYGNDSDSPTWIQENTAGDITRNVSDTGGQLVATTSATGSTVLQLTDIHGDVTVQLPVDSAVAPNVMTSDEYGNPEGTTAATRYGWLGGRQRSAETPTGVILMGVRLYDPSTGRFLSIDPVYRGNENAYGYPTDPVNRFDLDGRKVIKKYNKTGVTCGYWSCTLKLSRYRSNQLIDLINGGGKAGAIGGSIGTWVKSASWAKTTLVGALIYAAGDWVAWYLGYVLKYWPNRGTKIVYYYGWYISYIWHQ